MREILAQFAVRRAGVPAEAIRAADANRGEMVPLFLREFEQSAQADETTRQALFIAFHLLGQWREKSAYRPLAAFLRRSPEHVDDILGDAITVTAHRVMAALFDGDPRPLYDLILDSNVDEFIRSRMCATLAMVTLRGELPRDEAARFLQLCDTAIQSRDDCPVWDGWQNAIAMLGLAELTPIVRRAFEDGRIDPTWLEFKHFEQDLKAGIAGRSPRHAATKEYELFGDTIEELKTWDCFQPRKGTSTTRLFDESPGTIRNPLRNIGRNDPCPCGSGKKFKKCCINKSEQELLAMLDPAADEFDFDDTEEDLPDEADFTEFTGEMSYDPMVGPDPDGWRALDEQQRLAAVKAFHQRNGLKIPRDEAHAVLHVIIENQIAEGDDLPVRAKIIQLMAEGLDRHDAIHAVASVLIGHINDAFKQAQSGGDARRRVSPPIKDAYFAELKRLTARKWLRSA